MGIGLIFIFLFLKKTYFVGTHSNEYHNICFRGEIRKISMLLD